MPHDHYPDDCLYHKDALWLRLEGDGLALIGVTHFAQDQLGQVMYVDLPRVGANVGCGKALGTIESRKAVSDLVAPASGKVVEINPGLRTSPALVNQAPYGDGWLLRIRLAAFDGESGQLMNAAAYLAHLGLKG